MARTTMAYVLLATLLNVALADFRLASRPLENQNQGGSLNYKLRNENGAIAFVNNANVLYKYCEPSTFEYQGLAGNNGQKRKNYDNFLRSNIDNEQDNRNFVNNDGRDHMPFRTLDTKVCTKEGNVNLATTKKCGDSFLIPFRWNNPHASELEVNLWHLKPTRSNNKAMTRPVVVPMKKPTCSGEGYQDGIFEARVPTDFGKKMTEAVGGFEGCNENTRPMCMVQVYAHSVESRMYSTAFPIVVDCPAPAGTIPAAAGTVNVQNPYADPGLNLNSLRRLCRSNADALQHITTATPRFARMVSDVYNHAYQNSDFSPYSGQQFQDISQNLQASAVNKMVTGNRGELGKNAIPQAMKNKLNQLSNQEDQIYKRYEALANNIIKRLGNSMTLKDTGSVTALNSVPATTQQLANTFRALEAGTTKTKRQETNTYIPSFQIAAKNDNGDGQGTAALIAQARTYVPQKYAGLIDAQGRVEIYRAAMMDLMPRFQEAATDFGITYMWNQDKETLDAAPDATQFKKRNANGQQDNGKYAATQAYYLAAEARFNCPKTCLEGGPKAPIIRDSQGTSIEGTCTPCAAMFGLGLTGNAAVTDTEISKIFAVGDDANLPDIGTDEIEDYPDEDGTERVGRPPSPSTTTRKTYEPPPGWTPTGVGGGGAGVVGAAMRPIFDVCLMGMLALVVAMRD